MQAAKKKATKARGGDNDTDSDARSTRVRILRFYDLACSRRSECVHVSCMYVICL